MDSIRSIPFDKLNNDTASRIRRVVEKPTLFRRMPVQVVNCHPDLYLCLIRNPEIIVSIWELMGLTKVKMRRTGAFTFDASDGAGTVSKVELVYGDPQTHLLYCTGAYDGPLFRRALTGKCILLLRSGFSQSESMRDYVSSQLDVFLQLENVAADLVAKTLHPLVGKTADHNFTESTAFLGQISFAAETRPTALQRMISRLKRLQPAVRDEFARVAASVGKEAAKRRAMFVSDPKKKISTGRPPKPKAGRDYASSSRRNSTTGSARK